MSTDDTPRPSGDEALRAALVAAISDAADIRLPDGRLVIAVRHAAAIIENTALAAPSSAPDVEGLRAAQIKVVADVLGDALDGYGDETSWATIIVDRLAALATPSSAPAHGEGEAHDYSLVCKVCGQPGVIRVSIDPNFPDAHLVTTIEREFG